VAKACIGNAGRRASNEDVARLAAEYPDRLLGRDLGRRS
jgi:hypothetical protein